MREVHPSRFTELIPKKSMATPLLPPLPPTPKVMHVSEPLTNQPHYAIRVVNKLDAPLM